MDMDMDRTGLDWMWFVWIWMMRTRRERVDGQIDTGRARTRGARPATTNNYYGRMMVFTVMAA